MIILQAAWRGEVITVTNDYWDVLLGPEIINLSLNPREVGKKKQKNGLHLYCNSLTMGDARQAEPPRTLNKLQTLQVEMCY